MRSFDVSLVKMSVIQIHSCDHFHQKACLLWFFKNYKYVISIIKLRGNCLLKEYLLLAEIFISVSMFLWRFVYGFVCRAGKSCKTREQFDSSSTNFTYRCILAWYRTLLISILKMWRLNWPSLFPNKQNHDIFIITLKRTKISLSMLVSIFTKCMWPSLWKLA